MQSGNLPIIMAPPEQLSYINNIVQQNEFNAFCVDCQDNRATVANIAYGTYICDECAKDHSVNFPVVSYLKKLDEVWDPYQLKITEVGGNKVFYEFMKEYEKERVPVVRKYKTDAAAYYRKQLHYKAKGFTLDEKQPPRNAQELAERTALEAQLQAKKGIAATQEAWTGLDQKYKISENTSQLASKAKSGIMGLFGKSDTPAQQ